MILVWLMSNTGVLTVLTYLLGVILLVGVAFVTYKLHWHRRNLSVYFIGLGMLIFDLLSRFSEDVASWFFRVCFFLLAIFWYWLAVHHDKRISHYQKSQSDSDSRKK